MSLHDRNYARGSSGSGWSGSRGGSGGGSSDIWRSLNSLLNWSFPVGRVLGIRIRVHILFIIFAVTEVWPSQALVNKGVGATEQILWHLRWMGLLFGSVLLHEFGHCFGCRSVGGRADDILMWPLGGLAFCDPPKRPWPELVTVACGPLVNVALATLSFVTLLLWLGQSAMPVSLNPFEMWLPTFWLYEGRWVVQLLADLFVVNYALLLFNLLLIFYPFDGGRLVQIALWRRVGYMRSMRIATTLGMIGAVIVAGVGFYQRQGMLVIIAGFGFLTCLQQRQQLKYAASAEPEFDPRYAAAYQRDDGGQRAWFGAQGGTALREEEDGRGSSGGDGDRRPGAFARWQADRAAKRDASARKQAEADDQAIDRILDKVHASGLQSLTSSEKATLQRATDRQRGN